jgi:uncharacterized protein (TIGR04222 family)
MIEILSHASGPTFLMAFAGLSLVCIICARLWAQRDDSAQFPLPELSHLNPIEISVLRGGRNAAICTAIFGLWHRKLLCLKGNKAIPWIEAAPSSAYKGIPVEEVIYRFARTAREPSRFLCDAGLLLQTEVKLDSVYKKLIQLHLTRTGSSQKHVWQAFVTAFLVLAAVGGTRLVLDLMRGESVLLLLFLLLVSLIALLRMLKPRQGKPSQLGRRYLTQLRKHFEEMKASGNGGKSSPLPDPVLGVAIFGESILESDPNYKSFCKAFPGGFTKESRRAQIFPLGRELSGNIAEVPRDTESGGEGT